MLVGSIFFFCWNHLDVNILSKKKKKKKRCACSVERVWKLGKNMSFFIKPYHNFVHINQFILFLYCSSFLTVYLWPWKCRQCRSDSQWGKHFQAWVYLKSDFGADMIMCDGVRFLFLFLSHNAVRVNNQLYFVQRLNIACIHDNLWVAIILNAKSVTRTPTLCCGKTIHFCIFWLHVTPTLNHQRFKWIQLTKIHRCINL